MHIVIITLLTVYEHVMLQIKQKTEATEQKVK